MRYTKAEWVILLSLVGMLVMTVSSLFVAFDIERNKEDVIHAAHTANYRDVHVVSAEPINLTCHEEVAYYIEATDVNNERVSLVVCCGFWFGACTVRTPRR